MHTYIHTFHLSENEHLKSLSLLHTYINTCTHPGLVGVDACLCGTGEDQTDHHARSGVDGMAENIVDATVEEYVRVTDDVWDALVKHVVPAMMSDDLPVVRASAVSIYMYLTCLCVHVCVCVCVCVRSRVVEGSNMFPRCCRDDVR
jgi:hypothetical protein